MIRSVAWTAGVTVALMACVSGGPPQTTESLSIPPASASPVSLATSARPAALPGAPGPGRAALALAICGRRPWSTFSEAVHNEWERSDTLARALEGTLRGRALEVAPTAIGDLAPCLAVRRLDDRGAVLLVAPFRFTGRHNGALAYVAPSGTWRAFPLRRQADQTVVTPHAVIRSVAGSDLVATGLGEDGKAWLELYRLDESPRPLWRSGETWDFEVRSLGTDLLLTTSRPSAYHPQEQALWERSGERFERRATRTVPSIGPTVRAFADALRAGDRAAARVLATSPAVVEEAQPLADALYYARSSVTDRWDIEELGYWDALPEAYRGPRPNATTTEALSFAYHEIELVRDADAWRISAVRSLPNLPALAARFEGPAGLAADDVGNVYVADLGAVLRIARDGSVSRVAGTSARGRSDDGGPASAARLQGAFAVAVDRGRNMYIADGTEHRVRKVSADGSIATVAGTSTAGRGTDGPATGSALSRPLGVAVDGDGNVFIADSGNHRVRRVDRSGRISTVAGTGAAGFGGDGGPAIAAQLRFPTGLATDGGTLYIADTENHRIRMVGPSGVITTIAGTGVEGSSGDSGLATRAQLARPFAVVAGARGTVYVADSYNSSVRRLMVGSNIETVATGASSGIFGLALGPDGALFVGDPGERRVLVVRAGSVTTLAGSGEPLSGLQAPPVRPYRAGLVIELQEYGHTGPARTPLVILADGRAVTTSPTGALERRLSAGGLAAVIREVRESGLFADDRSFRAAPMPPPAIVGRGGAGAGVTLHLDGRAVTASYISYGPPDLPSPGSRRLSSLIDRLLALGSWLASDGWLDPAPRTFAASSYELTVSADWDAPARGSVPQLDLARLAWPLATPLVEFGKPLSEEGVQLPRCGELDAQAAATVLDAMQRSGVASATERAVQTTMHWTRYGAALTVSLSPLIVGNRACDH